VYILEKKERVRREGKKGESKRGESNFKMEEHWKQHLSW
jgi:hypothetical protein